MQEVLPEDAAELDRITGQLEPLWTALSKACAHIEAGMQGQWPSGADAPAVRILPPGASQVSHPACLKTTSSCATNLFAMS